MRYKHSENTAGKRLMRWVDLARFQSINQYVGIYCDFFIFMKFITHKNCLFRTFGTFYSHTTLRLYETTFDTSFELFCTLRNTISTLTQHIYSLQKELFFHVVNFTFQGKKNEKTRKEYRTNCNAKKNTCSILRIYSLCYTTLTYILHSLLKGYFLNTKQQHCWLIVQGYATTRLDCEYKLLYGTTP